MAFTITDDSLVRNLRRLQREAPQAMETMTLAAAAQGREFARDIVTQQIYATPQRSGYQRTRMLIRSIYGSTERFQNGGYAIIVGASAHYAAYNEFGTYQGYIGDDAVPDEIIERARRHRGEPILVQYPPADSGLEPRPFILPALVMVERELPGMVREALYRLTR